MPRSQQDLLGDFLRLGFWPHGIESEDLFGLLSMKKPITGSIKKESASFIREKNTNSKLVK
jgi:hypothetical protein